MTKYILSLLLLVGLSVSGAVASPADTLAHSLLWKITQPGVAQPSYLFGTIHMIGSEDYFLPKGLPEAFKKAGRVTFEIDVNKFSEGGEMLAMMDKLFMRGDSSLSDLLSAEDYGLVKKHFEQLGFPEFIYSKIKPMFLSTLSEQLQTGEEGEGEDSVKSYELELNQMAQNDGKEVKGLESAEFQLSLFDSIPYSIQAKMLVDEIKDGDQGSSASLDEMVMYYKNQNINKLYQLISKSDIGDNHFMELLIVKRNRNWVPEIMKQMKEKQTFFAVGAGHLPGTEGVINLLKKAGCKVEPVFK